MEYSTECPRRAKLYMLHQFPVSIIANICSLHSNSYRYHALSVCLALKLAMNDHNLCVDDMMDNWIHGWYNLFTNAQMLKGTVS